MPRQEHDDDRLDLVLQLEPLAARQISDDADRDQVRDPRCGKRDERSKDRSQVDGEDGRDREHGCDLDADQALAR